MLIANLAASAPPALSRAAHARACNAALTIVRTFTASQISGKPWIVGDSPADEDIHAFAKDGQALITQQWQGERPSIDLANAFASAQPTSATKECPEISAYLDRVGMQHGDAAASAAMAADPKENRMIKPFFSATIFSLSFPVMSENGDEALVDVAVGGGITAGAGSVHFLRRRPNGEWTDIGQLHTWIG
jgi:hypothetical protein